MKKIGINSVLTLLFCVFSMNTYGQNKNVYSVKGVAIEGYDLISYFQEGQALAGKKDFEVKYEASVYRFSTAENKSLFEKDPRKYLPAYGGYCAYAMGVNGSKVKIDPATFKITNGTLYLFYNFGRTNTLTKWNQDEINLAKKADAYWKKQISE